MNDKEKTRIGKKREGTEERGSEGEITGQSDGERRRGSTIYMY